MVSVVSPGGPALPEQLPWLPPLPLLSPPAPDPLMPPPVVLPPPAAEPVLLDAPAPPLPLDADPAVPCPLSPVVPPGPVLVPPGPVVVTAESPHPRKSTPSAASKALSIRIATEYPG